MKVCAFWRPLLVLVCTRSWSFAVLWMQSFQILQCTPTAREAEKTFSNPNFFISILISSSWKICSIRYPSSSLAEFIFFRWVQVEVIVDQMGFQLWKFICLGFYWLVAYMDPFTGIRASYKPNCIKGVHFQTYPASTSEGIKPVLTPPGASQGAGLSHTQVCTGTTQGQIWGRSQFVPWNVNAHVVLAWQNASGSDLRALCEGQMEELGFLLTLQSWCCILAVLSCWLKCSPAQSQTETKFLQATRWLPESCWKHHKCRWNCSVCIYWLSVCLHIFFSNRDANKPWEGQTRFTQEAIGALEPRCQ